MVSPSAWNIDSVGSSRTTADDLTISFAAPPPNLGTEGISLKLGIVIWGRGRLGRLLLLRLLKELLQLLLEPGASWGNTEGGVAGTIGAAWAAFDEGSFSFE
jgi:hypothetical protein